MSTFNPYRHLSAKVQALLRLEAKMSAEEREANQWQLLVIFSGTRVVVGKGGVNTCFLILGENGKRKVLYPDSLLEILATLGSQSFWVYDVVSADGSSRRMFSEKQLLSKLEPERGMKVFGIKGSARKLFRKATKGLEAYEWKP